MTEMSAETRLSPGYNTGAELASAEGWWAHRDQRVVFRVVVQNVALHQPYVVCTCCERAKRLAKTKIACCKLCVLCVSELRKAVRTLLPNVEYPARATAQ